MKTFKLTMDENSVFNIDGDRRGTIISCTKGTVYITQQNDFNDHILSVGENFVVSKKGRVITWALSSAAIEIVSADTASCCWMGRLRHFALLCRE